MSSYSESSGSESSRSDGRTTSVTPHSTASVLLVVKAQRGGATARRITYSDAYRTSVETFRCKIERCFALHPTQYRITYKDDDADETEISSDADLREALDYFATEAFGKTSTTSSDQSLAPTTSRTKITMRVSVQVEYDGPALSDSGSAAESASGSNGGVQERRMLESTPSHPTGNSIAAPRHPEHDRPWVFDAPQQDSYPPIPLPALRNGFTAAPRSVNVRQHLPNGNSTNGGSNEVAPRRSNPYRIEGASSISSGASSASLEELASLVGSSLDIGSVSRTTTRQNARLNGSREYDNESDMPSLSDGRGPSRSGPGSIVSSSAATTDIETPSEGRGLPSPSDRRYNVAVPRGYDESSQSAWTETTESQVEDDHTDVGDESEEMRRLAISRMNIRQDFSHSIAEGVQSSRVSVLSRLSIVPDDLIRCSICEDIMAEIRYICEICGPIRPPSPTHRELKSVSEAGDNEEALSPVKRDNAYPAQNSFLLPPTSIRNENDAKQAQDPGFQRSTRAGLANESSGYASSLDSQSEASRDRHDLRSQGSRSNSTPATSVHNELAQGFELCVRCVANHGQIHANAMVARGDNGDVRRDEAVRHAFEEVMKAEEGGWKEVEFEDLVHCTLCAKGPLERNRFKCLSCPKYEMCLECYKKVQEYHPCHVFLAVPDRPIGPSQVASRDSNSSRLSTWADLTLAPSPRRHVGISCAGCMQDIVGARFKCSMCLSFDLCSRCEAAIPPIALPDGLHDPQHILLKIPFPMDEVDLSDAHNRVLQMIQSANSSSTASGSSDGSRQSLQTDFGATLSRGAHHPGRSMPPPPPMHAMGPGPHQYLMHHHPRGFPSLHPPPLPPRRLGPPSPPPRMCGPPPPLNVFPFPGFNAPLGPLSLPPVEPASMNLQNVGGALMTNGHAGLTTMSVMDHQIHCGSCQIRIIGTRWLCSNCPTEPSFDLCEGCERRQTSMTSSQAFGQVSNIQLQIVHDPMHAFIKITFPIRGPLPSVTALVPILYKGLGSQGSRARPHRNNRLSETISGDVELATFSSDGNNITHANVLCDLCMEQIKGGWLRCCNCIGSYDVCETCALTMNPQHDRRHVFIKFTRPVDMALFKDLVQLGTSRPQSLLSFSLYD